MRLALIATALIVLCSFPAHSHEKPVGPDGPPVAVCTKEYGAKADAAWRKAVEALKANDIKEVKARTEETIAACGTTFYSWWPRVLRADVALNDDKDPAAAVKLLAPVPRSGEQPLSQAASWRAMQANLALTDDAAFLSERDALMAEVDRAIVDPRGPAKGAKRETFMVNDTQVVAYDVDLAQGPFRRRYYFAILRKGAFYPESVMITINTMIEAMGGGKGDIHYFVDAYFCGGHATLGNLPTPRVSADAKPKYEEARAFAEKYARGQAAPVSATNVGGERCAFPAYMVPGLDQ